MAGSPVWVQFRIVGMRLPAAAASTAAIATVAVPASTTATATAASRPSSAAWPATTATAWPPATTTEAASRPSTASAWSPASTTTAFTGRPCFVDHNVAAHEIVAVQSLHGAVSFLVVIDFDKSEAAWLTRKTVAHQGNDRRGDSRLSK